MPSAASVKHRTCSLPSNRKLVWRAFCRYRQVRDGGHNAGAVASLAVWIGLGASSEQVAPRGRQCHVGKVRPDGTCHRCAFARCQAGTRAATNERVRPSGPARPIPGPDTHQARRHPAQPLPGRRVRVFSGRRGLRRPRQRARLPAHRGDHLHPRGRRRRTRTGCRYGFAPTVHRSTHAEVSERQVRA